MRSYIFHFLTALKYHPDRNKEEGANVKFQKIGEAFEVLGDQEKRANYDAASRKNHLSAASATASDLFAHFFSDTSHFDHYSSSSSSDEDDLFHLFSNIPKRPRYHPPSPPYKQQSIKRTLPVSLNDLYTGTTKRMKVTKTVFDSHGFPASTDKILTIRVVPGWKSGTKVRFPGEGDASVTGEAQDIEFEIVEKPHPVYTRHEDNLHTTMTLTLLQALTGFKKELTTLDGKTITVEEPEGTIIHSGQEKILIGEGMPNYHTGEKGDLIITFQVELPTVLSDNQRAALKKVLVN